MPLAFSSEDHKDVSSSSWKQAIMCCSPSEPLFEGSSRALETEGNIQTAKDLNGEVNPFNPQILGKKCLS